MTHFPQLDAFRGGNGVVRLIGHRGARGIMPENTMEGFEFTLSLGVQALEFDVVMTRDHVPVITHNHHLSAEFTRDASGAFLHAPEPRVAELTLAELQAFDVGGLDPKAAYGQRFPDQAYLSGVRTPRLSELLAMVQRPKHSDVALLLEIKADPAQREDHAARAALVAAVVADIRGHALGPRTILHSFDWDLLDECRRQAPELPTSYLSEVTISAADDPIDPTSPDHSKLKMSLPSAVAQAGGQMWCPFYMDVTPDLVAEAHDLGLLVQTWTVNLPRDIEAMIDAGVDGICTDYPGRVQRHLNARGLRWVC
jgi:glycerophosphoryl diester phosphodiesterase